MNKQRKTSHILNVFQYDADGHVVLPASLTLSIAPASGDNNSKVPTTAWVRTYVTGLSYLTGNQSITVSGDATGSGTTSIALTLANTAVTPGTYGSATLVPVVTVDSKGRITSVTTAAISGSLTFTGDVTGTGTTGTSTAMTLAASGVTAGTYTKVTVDSKGRVTVGASATTSDISEGTNLYYTDARVLSYLSANTYATQSYVNTQVSNLVAAAPATLDTLNELAAALGNDPSFATTISTALGNRLRVDINNQGLSATLQGYGRTNLGLGTAATSNTGDFVAYRTFGTAANSAVGDFVAYRTFGTAANNNTGDFALASHTHSIANVTGLQTALDGKQASLGFTPYNSTNPSGYITGITSANVTTALGFTPYNATNPAGYITGVTNISGTAGSISGFNNPTTAATANTIVYRDGSGDIYGRYLFGSYQNSSDDVSAGTITYIMAKFGDNYHRSATAAKVQAFLGLGSAAYQNTGAFLSTSGSVTIGGYLTVTGAGTSSSIYMSDTDNGQREIHCNSDRIGFLTQAGAWGAYADDAGNWFANNLSGTNTGDQTNITGNAATANSAATVTGSSTINGYLTLSTNWNVSPYTSAFTIIGTHPSMTFRGSNGDTHYLIHMDSAGDIQYYFGPGYTTNNWVQRYTFSKGGNFTCVTGTISATNFSGSSSGTNTGDQTNISGRAGSTLNWYATSHPNDYYLVNNWTGTYWRITSNHPSGVQVAYADTAGSAPANGGTSSNTNSISNALGNTHTWTGAQNNFLGNGDTGGTNNVGMIIYSTGGNGAQFSFHRAGHYAINMGLDSDNVIRIGGWSASPNRFQMDMSGNLTMSGDVTAYSDARVKENIVTIENALNKVLALRGVSYNRIDSDDKKTKIGVIAQETLPIVPEVVNQDNDGMFNVSYGNLAGLFIEAIKEQQLQIEELKNKLDSLLQN